MALEMERQRETQERNRSRRDANVDGDLLEFEDSLKSKRTREREERRADTLGGERGKWEAVDDDVANMREVESSESSDEDYKDPRAGPSGSATTSARSAILDEEPDLQRGVAAAIQMADKKGYWEKGERRSTGRNLNHLQAKNYTIDDKAGRGGDDDRGRGGRERYGGATQPFEEKKNFKPNVQLEYIDDDGRRLTSKEAFK